MEQLNQKQQILLAQAYKYEETHREFLDKNMDLFGDKYFVQLAKLVLDTLKMQESSFTTLFPVVLTYLASTDLNSLEYKEVLSWVSDSFLS